MNEPGGDTIYPLVFASVYGKQGKIRDLQTAFKMVKLKHDCKGGDRGMLIHEAKGIYSGC